MSEALVMFLPNINFVTNKVIVYMVSSDGPQHIAQSDPIRCDRGDQLSFRC